LALMSARPKLRRRKVHWWPPSSSMLSIRKFLVKGLYSGKIVLI
jgi:hypothetical protein